MSQLSGKCKVKPQSDTTSHPLTWLKDWGGFWGDGREAAAAQLSHVPPVDTHVVRAATRPNRRPEDNVFKLTRWQGSLTVSKIKWVGKQTNSCKPCVLLPRTWQKAKGSSNRAPGGSIKCPWGREPGESSISFDDPEFRVIFVPFYWIEVSLSPGHIEDKGIKTPTLNGGVSTSYCNKVTWRAFIGVAIFGK